jgi:hypothetical protein
MTPEGTKMVHYVRNKGFEKHAGYERLTVTGWLPITKEEIDLLFSDGFVVFWNASKASL